MTIYRGLLSSFVIGVVTVGVLLGQSHPVGSEWPCSACSSGLVCYRESAEVTSCRVPQGSRPVTRGPDIAAKVAAATAQIQQNPRDPNAWVRRASAYLTPASATAKPPLQNLEAAILDLEQALRLDPNNFYARHNYGHAAYLLGYQDYAIYEFDRALQIDPRSARTWMGRGWSWYEKCELDRASSDFDRAVSLDQTLASSIARPAEIDSRRTECARIAWQLAHPPPRARGIHQHYGPDLGAAGGRPAGGRGSGERRQRVRTDHQGEGRHPVTRAFSSRCPAELRRRV